MIVVVFVAYRKSCKIFVPKPGSHYNSIIDVIKKK